MKKRTLILGIVVSLCLALAVSALAGCKAGNAVELIQTADSIKIDARIIFGNEITLEDYLISEGLDVEETNPYGYGFSVTTVGPLVQEGNKFLEFWCSRDLYDRTEEDFNAYNRKVIDGVTYYSIDVFDTSDEVSEAPHLLDRVKLSSGTVYLILLADYSF